MRNPLSLTERPRTTFALLWRMLIISAALCLSWPVGADFSSGLAAYKKQDFAAARSEWQRVAEQGNTTAMLMLGRMYERGEGVPADSAKAADWYRQAAAKGDNDAKRALDGLAASTPQGIAVPSRVDTAAAAAGALPALPVPGPASAGRVKTAAGSGVVPSLLSAPVGLWERLPVNTVGYARVPSIWGLLTAPKDNALQQALTNENHLRQIQALETALYTNVLKDAEQWTGPLLSLLLHRLRSPVEMALIQPENAPLPLVNVLVVARLGYATVEELNQAMPAAFAGSPVKLVKPLGRDGFGTAQAGATSAFVHFDAGTGVLSLLSGLSATEKQLKQLLAQIKTTAEHPMYALQNQIDTSHQGLFLWLDMAKLRPGLEATMPPPKIDEANRWGILDIGAIALGWGERDGKSRLKCAVLTPRSGHLGKLPRLANDLTLAASGEPRTLVLLALPTAELLNWFEKVLQLEKPEEYQSYLSGKAAIEAELGFRIDDLARAIGPEMVAWSDSVGEFLAVRVSDPAMASRVLELLVNREKAVYETRNLEGTVYHHLAVPQGFLAELPPASNPLEAYLLELLGRGRSHYYWVEDEGYVIFSQVPQGLMERQVNNQRVRIQDWLKTQQRQDISGSLLAFSTRVQTVPRYLYYLYLIMLDTLGDLAQHPVDLFALPTPSRIGLPSEGTYGLQLDLSATQLSFELTFESNPLEFLLNPSVGTLALLGVAAAVAVPAAMELTAEKTEEPKP